MPTAQCYQCSKPATTMFDGLPMCDDCYGQLRPMPAPVPQVTSATVMALIDDFAIAVSGFGQGSEVSLALRQVLLDAIAASKPTPPPNSPIAQVESKLAVPITITDSERRGLAVGSWTAETVMFEALDKTRPAMFRLVLKHEELPATIAALQLLWQEREMARMRGVEFDRDEQARREIERMMEPSPGIKDGDE